MPEERPDQSKGEIVIYKSAEGPQVLVKFADETVWLSQSQMAELFGKDVRTVNEHIKNIFKEAELSQNSVIRKFRITAKDGKTYYTAHYNLDVIISVGYRVKSKRGTQFRIWATEHLRDYILRGYAVNEKRLKEGQVAKLKELETAHKLIAQALESKRAEGYERELLRIINDYANTWFVLNLYDNDKLKIEDVSAKTGIGLDYDDVVKNIARFKQRLLAQKQATEIFGQEVGGKLKALLGNLEQTFSGRPVYKSLEERAAHLLYFAIKDHPFVDGNKRIGSLLFLFFLIENHFFYNRRGERKINDSALVALALLIAESKPVQKDVMIKLVVNLINKK
ncbi:MAG: virulence RhuM family protein [Patescibacteria group bacterium]|nr:virulence RhuM family protein [Patescibacteria group bacterium]